MSAIAEPALMPVHTCALPACHFCPQQAYRFTCGIPVCIGCAKEHYG